MRFLIQSIFLSLLIYSPLSGQNSVGVSIGVDITNVAFFNFSIPENYFEDVGFSYPSIELGLQSKHSLSEKLKLHLSIHHTSKRNVYRADKIMGTKLDEYKIDFDLIKSYGIVQYELFNNFGIGIGLSHRYIMNGKTINRKEEKESTTYNRTNMAFVIGMSYTYNRVQCNINFARGQKLSFNYISIYKVTERINNIDFRISYMLFD